MVFCEKKITTKKRAHVHCLELPDVIYGRSLIAAFLNHWDLMTFLPRLVTFFHLHLPDLLRNIDQISDLTLKDSIPKP